MTSSAHGSVNGSSVHSFEIVLADLFLYEVDKRELCIETMM